MHIGRLARLLTALALTVGAAVWLGGSTPARALDWPTIAVTRVTSGLRQPVHLTHAGDGSGRLFVVERAGAVRIVRQGAIAATPFLDITSRVRSTGSEQGLLSIAFPPDFAQTGRFYVDYTRQPDGATVVARYRLASVDAADPTSEEILLTIAQPFINHNGGLLAFGPRDGYLYIGTGDGGSGGDPNNRAQNPADLLGKLLRLDVSGPTGYTVPPTNPTFGAAQPSPVWAIGLRNPWRFAFDRQTGDLYIGDVGQDAVEEIDFQSAASAGGENYGWRRMEGSQCYNPPTSCATPELTLPVAEYTHALGCSVTGGFVYRGRDTALDGLYLYGDYCSGRIWGLRRAGDAWTTRELLRTSLLISSFGEDEPGELYVLDFAGAIYAISGTNTPTATPTPTATVTPAAAATPTATVTPSATVTASPGSAACQSNTGDPLPASPRRRTFLPLAPRGCSLG